MHVNHLPTFNDKLQNLPHSHRAFDNYQRSIRKKCVSVGKSAITQVGTALLLREDRPFHLPPGTKMRSPRGVPLVVSTCVPHSVTHSKIMGFMPLEYMMWLSASNVVCSDLHLYDQRRIIEGFLHPEIGWTVTHVPGLSPMPPVTYVKQEIPPPLNAWVATGTSYAKLLFGASVADRGLRVYNGNATTSFTSTRMHNLQRQATRLTDMRVFVQHLEKERVQAEDRKNSTDCGNIILVS
jgi:hypothetical protein